MIKLIKTEKPPRGILVVFLFFIFFSQPISKLILQLNGVTFSDQAS